MASTPSNIEAALKLAHEYRNAGISVIPLKLDGSKEPIGSWKPYQTRIATEQEVDQWFKRLNGLGLVCGYVSGGLEVIDFDDGSLFDPWRRMVSTVVDKLPVVETPSGGWHVLFRCKTIGGNIKIAMDPNREEQTLIETRGEGGLIVAEGTPCATHPTGLPYVQYSGPYLPTIPTISEEERTELWRAARTFDLRGEEFQKSLTAKYLEPQREYSNSDQHPAVVRFIQQNSWQWLLERHGWRTFDGTHWIRPGKHTGTSAKLVKANDGTDVLVVFSGNAGPLSPDGSHRTCNLFLAWTLLEHGGSYKAALAACKGVAA